MKVIGCNFHQDPPPPLVMRSCCKKHDHRVLELLSIRILLIHAVDIHKAVSVTLARRVENETFKILKILNTTIRSKMQAEQSI